MYQIFRNVVSKPITMIIGLVLVVIVIFSLTSSVTSVMTWFGVETKENVKEKLVKTEIQLDKAIEIAKNNEADKVLNEKIDIVNNDIAKETEVINNKITEDENKILDELKKLSSISDKPIAKHIDSKIVSNKPKVGDIGAKDSTISINQIKKLELLVSRSQQLKGAVK